MSQPEMQPGGTGRDDELADTGAGTRSARPADGGGGTGGGGTGGPEHGELVGGPFPLGDWGEPAQRLDELYRWVETGALHTVRWYLADRVRRRLTARALRGGTALGVVTGVALPLLDLAGKAPGTASWGCLALLLGGACLACDRYFGVTSGWMRHVATAQAVQRRLQTLQFDWAAESVREVLGPTEGTASEAAERCLGVLRRFCEDVTELVRAETADWMVEFRGGVGTGALLLQSAPLNRSGEAPTSPPPRPFAAGTRPNMPRQRPPEPR
ncbi:SLATT domain-containing protein [Streptomyces sp. 8L]|uniref:SLATT domain-containing protein n=1 Tax=Streptomyces sp. 8L TaxID=2877242 RepID=UPI001CD73822|nr:SLATT domain-containing protein [Streptomyces sp. 8L]MCA1221484.1 SLATT domain-containing protein [Streptomyces sp. 8L]